MLAERMGAGQALREEELVADRDEEWSRVGLKRRKLASTRLTSRIGLPDFNSFLQQQHRPFDWITLPTTFTHCNKFYVV